MQIADEQLDIYVDRHRIELRTCTFLVSFVFTISFMVDIHALYVPVFFFRREVVRSPCGSVRDSDDDIGKTRKGLGM